MDFRGWLIRAPWWAWSLYWGSLLGLARFGFQLVDGRSFAAAAIGGVAQGVLTGLILGPFSRRASRRYLAAMGDVPVAKQREVRRAATGGPVPTDPEVRKAALAVITFRIDATRRARRALVVWFLAIGLSVWLAVVDSPWWLLAVLVFAGLLARQLWTPRQLERRRLLLAGSPTGHEPSTAERF